MARREGVVGGKGSVSGQVHLQPAWGQILASLVKKGPHSQPMVIFVLEVLFLNLEILDSQLC